MTKQIEDYPELVKFRQECKWDAVTIHKNEYYAYGEQDVEEKLLEMQSKIDSLRNAHTDRVNEKIELENECDELYRKIDSLTEQNKELQKQINFKIDECITLAKACNRWKVDALNKESK